MSKNQIVHLGHEYDGHSSHNAELLLKGGHTVTMVGLGPSMHPIIPNRTRMVIEPWPERQRPEKYQALFCRVPTVFGTQYTLHLCWDVKRRKFLMVDTGGHIHGHIPFKNICGRYVGAWEDGAIVPYLIDEWRWPE